MQQYIAQRCNTQQYIAQQRIAQRYAMQQYTAQQYTAQLYIAQLYIAQQYSTQQYIAQQRIAQRYAMQQYTAQLYIAQLYIAQLYIAHARRLLVPMRRPVLVPPRPRIHPLRAIRRCRSANRTTTNGLRIAKRLPKPAPIEEHLSGCSSFFTGHYRCLLDADERSA